MTDTRPEAYVTHPGLNWSRLRHIDRSPLHYRHAIEHPSPPSASQSLGTLAHFAVLEPHRLNAVAVPPADVLGKNGARSTKAYREWADEQPAGTIIASQGEVDEAWAIGDAVRAHGVAFALLTGSEVEVPLFWEERGRAMKALCDVLHRQASEALAFVLGIEPGTPVLCDLKTTSDLSGFARHAARYGYHGQLAHYAAGVEAETGEAPEAYIIAVESSAPYDVAVYHLTDALAAGRRMRARLLDTLDRCEASDSWPGVSPSIVALDVPSWAQ